MAGIRQFVSLMMKVRDRAQRVADSRTFRLWHHERRLRRD
jgi:hypothetical protein